jgi:uncharacterized protein YecA (UPF0149 family)
MLRFLLPAVLAAGGYFWLGVPGMLAAAIVAFMVYQLLTPPRRYRRMGPGQIDQAVDHRLGHFGRTYLEHEPEEFPEKVGRNDPCPCGSDRKFKRCCGSAAR